MDSAECSPDERTHLLPEPQCQPRQESMANVYWRPTIICILLYFIMGIGYFSSTAAQLRLLESIICRAHYEKANPALIPPSGDIPESLCKVPAVQGTLAELLGWQAFFDNIPSLVLVLPYGIWADKYGRKLVITLSFVGQTLGMAWVVFVCTYIHSLPNSIHSLNMKRLDCAPNSYNVVFVCFPSYRRWSQRRICGFHDDHD
jgi:MFS family permease